MGATGTWLFAVPCILVLAACAPPAGPLPKPPSSGPDRGFETSAWEPTPLSEAVLNDDLGGAEALLDLTRTDFMFRLVLGGGRVAAAANSPHPYGFPSASMKPTPLAQAVMHDDIDRVRSLLDQGTDPNAR